MRYLAVLVGMFLWALPTISIYAQVGGASTEWESQSSQSYDSPLAQEKGVQTLLSVSNHVKSNEPLAKVSQAYHNDFLEWASFAMNSFYLPSDISEHLVALPSGSLFMMLGPTDGRDAVDKRAYKDGFCVRYAKGDYSIEIQDSRHALLIIARNTKLGHACQKEAERAAYAKRVMMDLLSLKVTCYPNGSARLTCQLNKERSIFLYWRWQSLCKEEDSGWSCKGAFLESGARPYRSVISIKTDGQLAIITLIKQYAGSVDVPMTHDDISRFDERSRFHDLTPKQLFEMKEKSASKIKQGS